MSNDRANALGSAAPSKGWVSGFGPGLCGPTCRTVGGAFCGGKDWYSWPVSVGMETIALCPNQRDPKSGAQIMGSGEEIAEHIVRAVNSHDDLLEACKRASEILKSKGAPGWGVAKDILNAAIAKAEGRS